MRVAAGGEMLRGVADDEHDRRNEGGGQLREGGAHRADLGVVLCEVLDHCGCLNRGVFVRLAVHAASVDELDEFRCPVGGDAHVCKEPAEFAVRPSRCGIERVQSGRA